MTRISANFLVNYSALPHFYLSSTRGNDTIGLCTYEQPCQTLEYIFNNWGQRTTLFSLVFVRLVLLSSLLHRTGTGIQLTLLTGYHNMSAFEWWTGWSSDALNIVGQKDCFPMPRNFTSCNSPLPIIDSIRSTYLKQINFNLRILTYSIPDSVESHTRELTVTIENLVMRPNRPPILQQQEDCVSLFELTNAGAPGDVINVHDVVIDASYAVDGAICVQAPIRYNFTLEYVITVRAILSLRDL